MLPVQENCSGCGACASSCPHNCIEMEPDNEGFRYPVVDYTRCVSCGLCENVCPLLKKPALSGNTYAVAAKNLDDEIRKDSSSGGVFSALAFYTLDKGGIVCAAIYDENQKVRHICIDQKSGIKAMRGAKYAQSEAEHCFSEIQEQLESGRYVLFVGTPCQTAGLSAYLGQSYDSLLLVDMICHGVPSPKVWEKYLIDRTSIDAPESAISSINLRSKESGWSRYSYSVRIDYENGTTYLSPQGQDLFMKGFVQNLYLRPSCSKCGFKGIERISDLTLGDCWGIWDIAPDFDDNQGTSLLLIHSEKGKNVWDEISGSFRYMTMPDDQAVLQNPSAVRSSAPHPNRDCFFKSMETTSSVVKLIQTSLFPKKKGLFEQIIMQIRKMKR